uniref:Uncharacterized protein n=1 Tax=Arundo donax TaxID=35708 RepID=A0A0A9C170_ARUDO
MHVRMYEQ